MKTQFKQNSNVAEKVRVSVVDVREQARRMHAAIARRAYDIFQTQGAISGHALDHWRQAESELVRPMCFGEMPVDGGIWIGADVSAFLPGSVELWISPRQLTVSGKRRLVPGRISPLPTNTEPADEFFRVATLPVEIDPSAIQATIKAQSLEVFLRKAQLKQPEHEVRAA